MQVFVVVFLHMLAPLTAMLKIPLLIWLSTPFIMEPAKW